MALGLEKARELVDRTSNVEGLFIERTNPGVFNSIVSSGWPYSLNEETYGNEYSVTFN